jgi:molybdopterin/thiamine biosynthesis adenylyltransferase
MVPTLLRMAARLRWAGFLLGFRAARPRSREMMPETGVSFTMSMLEVHLEALTAALFDGSGNERAAYLICGIARMPSEIRLLVRDVVPVTKEEMLSSSPSSLSIAGKSVVRAIKNADLKRAALLFAHSHPTGFSDFSPQDDREERKLFETAYGRIHHEGPHGSLMMAAPYRPIGRIWLIDGSTAPIKIIRILGKRFRFLHHAPDWEGQGDRVRDLTFFDRQIRAFGPDLQPLLRSLTVGVVGAGGTGSCVIEQLIRLGVGNLVIADPQGFDPSNVNRVYGSRVIDGSIPKVKIAERLAFDVGLGTRLKLLPQAITKTKAFRELRGCDAVFGCTDDERGRSILGRLAVWYYVPVFDMGVKIDSTDGEVRSIQGRVTTLMPGLACLLCRGRIAGQLRQEAMNEADPDEAELLRKEGYLPELEEPAPAVIPFTTMVAASAISEFLHRLTGFLGEERESSEVLHRIDETRLRTNNPPSREGCMCSDPAKWGRGDLAPALGLTWAE